MKKIKSVLALAILFVMTLPAYAATPPLTGTNLFWNFWETAKVVGSGIIISVKSLQHGI